MQQVLNTLYVTTPGAYVRLDHETLRVDLEGQTQLQVPLQHLGGIVCFGDVMVSPALMRRCAEEGRALTLLDRNGRFKARLVGPTSGNVLLRRAQHLTLSDGKMSASIARNVVAAKIQNARQVLLRGARQSEDPQDASPLRQAAEALARNLTILSDTNRLEEIRGLEGDSAHRYFSAFDRMVTQEREAFVMQGRTRRPPTDPMNALLSFLYTLLLGDCISGCEAVGLDPQVGYLHALRPGRPALALDLMEELRAVLADRLTLSLVNLRQVSPKDFEKRPGGAVYLSEKARKTVIVAYQKRKQDEIQHPVLEKKIAFGLVPHVQARLLARHLRGDLQAYPPFLYK